MAMLALAGCGGARPEETFAEAKRAMETRDWKALYAAFEPESSDWLLFALAAAAGYSAGDDEAASKELSELLDRHGADAKEMKEATGSREKVGRALRRTFADVRDREALFVELMEFNEKRSKQAEPFRILGERLQDVEVKGDTATAAMALKDGSSRELKFTRVEGRWRISVRP